MTLPKVVYDAILDGIVAADTATNAKSPQYQGFWDADDCGPFLLRMNRRWASKGRFTAYEKGDIVVGKMARPFPGETEASYVVVGLYFPGHHSGVELKDATRVEVAG